MNKTRIVFFGTPKFSEIVLQKLFESVSLSRDVQDGFEIVGVVTALDKIVGRKKVLTPPLVKVLAQEKGVPVFQPQKLNEEFVEQLKSLELDLCVVASYGKIIPQAVLDIPRRGNINVHPSLLPKYRGPSPIQWALLNGDDKTGVTIMLMDEKMDHGATINSKQLTINKDEKFSELHDRLAHLGAELLVESIPKYLSGEIKAQEQKHEQATFCKMIKKEDGKIDWSLSAEEIYNLWRAFEEWPGVYSKQGAINNKQGMNIKFIEIKNVGTGLDLSYKKPGEFFTQDKKLYVACGDNTALEILKLQPEGKKAMDAQAFINGYLKKD